MSRLVASRLASLWHCSARACRQGIKSTSAVDCCKKRSMCRQGPFAVTASVGPPPRIRRYRSAGTRGQDGAEIRGSERDITHTGPQPHILYPPPRLPPLLPHSSAPSSSAPPLLLLLAAASLSSAAAGEGLNPFRHRLRHRSSIRASFRVAAGPVGASQRGSQWRPRPAVARAGAAKATRGRRKRKVYICPATSARRISLCSCGGRHQRQSFLVFFFRKHRVASSVSQFSVA